MQRESGSSVAAQAHWVDTTVEWLLNNRPWLSTIPKGHIEIHGAGTVIRPTVTRAFGEVKPS